MEEKYHESIDRHLEVGRDLAVQLLNKAIGALEPDDFSAFHQSGSDLPDDYKREEKTAFFSKSSLGRFVGDGEKARLTMDQIYDIAIYSIFLNDASTTLNINDGKLMKLARQIVRDFSTASRAYLSWNRVGMLAGILDLAYEASPEIVESAQLQIEKKLPEELLRWNLTSAELQRCKAMALISYLATRRMCEYSKWRYNFALTPSVFINMVDEKYNHILPTKGFMPNTVADYYSDARNVGAIMALDDYADGKNKPKSNEKPIKQVDRAAILKEAAEVFSPQKSLMVVKNPDAKIPMRDRSR